MSEILCASRHVIAEGAMTSLTRGAVPEDGWVVLDTRQQKEIHIEKESRSVTVQPGVKFREVQVALAAVGLYYPPGPTEEEASFGGMISCNAAGAATFKYGQTRPWVKRIEVVLANGEILDIRRGQCKARDGHFILENANGAERRIDVPTYKMPDVPKSSAGYYAEPDMDLIDLFIGSEGTLGVITKATLDAIPMPSIHWALVACPNEQKALDVNQRLRELSLETREKRKGGDINPRVIDISAIEYVDAPSMRVLREDGQSKRGITPPLEAKTMLIIQVEKADGDTSEELGLRLLSEVEKYGLSEGFQFAPPDNTGQIKYLTDMRKAVPDGVNRRVKENQVTKMAGDFIVPMDKVKEMLEFARKTCEDLDLDLYIWGHSSDGNFHPNIVAKTPEDAELAKRALFEIGKKVIELGGSPIAEHGVGRNKTKQALLKLLYTPAEIGQMRQVKRALDPEGKLAPGNIFAMSEG